ncbi:MAG TPA: class I SAM-dependent methyltransferase [Acetobacteraceae bacterium]
MDLSEFDRFADEYRDIHRANIAITGEAPEYFANYKIDLLLAAASAHDLDARRILDFGSGVGSSIPAFRRCFPAARLTCADVSQRSLDVAALRFPGFGVGMRIAGSQVPAEDQAFDLSFSACVFHHIAPEEHVSWLRELHRVTRPGGLLSVFEHNPLNPLTRHAVNTCPFDVNARLIGAGRLARLCLQAGWRRPRVRYHLFFPRAMAALRPLERWLSFVPCGAQYSVAAERH